ncbi:hypothetical protein D3C78_1014420 [compost metagenome]
MALRFKPLQTLGEPDDALPDRAQLARAFEHHGVTERFALPQTIDHSLNTLHRADDHAGEKQHQSKADQKQHQRLPAKELTALGDLLL